LEWEQPVKETLLKIWHAWKKFGQFLNDWVARVILSIFYFTIFMPFGIGVRLLLDPLTLKPDHTAKWQERVTTDLDLKDGKKLH
jgi:hypothetical protein